MSLTWCVDGGPIESSFGQKLTRLTITFCVSFTGGDKKQSYQVGAIADQEPRRREQTRQHQPIVVRNRVRYYIIFLKIYYQLARLSGIICLLLQRLLFASAIRNVRTVFSASLAISSSTNLDISANEVRQQITFGFRLGTFCASIHFINVLLRLFTSVKLLTSIFNKSRYNWMLLHSRCPMKVGVVTL